MLAELLTPTSLIALLTLTILEVVLGVDNVIFIAIVSGGLPAEQRPFAQRVGLGLALIGRIGLVLGVSWLLGLEKGLFTLVEHEFSASDLILLGGGLFLLYKAVHEIFATTECKEEEEQAKGKASMAATIAQIVLIDMIFAIDSVLTAVGLTKQVALIIIAMSIAVAVMMFYATPLSDFIHRHPSVKLLALSFLVLVGVMLFLDGVGQHIDRDYVYVAILFSMGVEALNFRRQRNLERKRAKAAPQPADA